MAKVPCWRLHGRTRDVVCGPCIRPMLRCQRACLSARPGNASGVGAAPRCQLRPQLTALTSSGGQHGVLHARHVGRQRLPRQGRACSREAVLLKHWQVVGIQCPTVGDDSHPRHAVLWEEAGALGTSEDVAVQPSTGARNHLHDVARVQAEPRLREGLALLNVFGTEGGDRGGQEAAASLRWAVTVGVESRLPGRYLASPAAAHEHGRRNHGCNAQHCHAASQERNQCCTRVGILMACWAKPLAARTDHEGGRRAAAVTAEDGIVQNAEGGQLECFIPLHLQAEAVLEVPPVNLRQPLGGAEREAEVEVQQAAPIHVHGAANLRPAHAHVGDRHLSRRGAQGRSHHALQPSSHLCGDVAGGNHLRRQLGRRHGGNVEDDAELRIAGHRSHGCRFVAGAVDLQHDAAPAVASLVLRTAPQGGAGLAALSTQACRYAREVAAA
mmetsp:Transcript_34624/g.99476  ORF Transcript_34624/g.99476 Transcript_34624/m.99476 type:complete len:441 (+) Transcript_34624:118-1440(+)